MVRFIIPSLQHRLLGLPGSIWLETRQPAETIHYRQVSHASGFDLKRYARTRLDIIHARKREQRIDGTLPLAYVAAVVGVSTWLVMQLLEVAWWRALIAGLVIAVGSAIVCVPIGLLLQLVAYAPVWFRTRRVERRRRQGELPTVRPHSRLYGAP